MHEIPSEKDSAQGASPLGLGAMGIQHVTIHVSDVARARRFYGQVLGLTEVPRPSWFDFKGAWFVVGQQQIHLVHSDPLPPRTREHFCIQVADLIAAEKHLESHGVARRPDRDIAGVRRFIIYDPDKNYVEIAEISQPWPTQWPAEPLPEYMRAALE